MPMFLVSYERTVKEWHEVRVEADSESAVRQMWIDGAIPVHAVESDILSESDPQIDQLKF